MVKPMKCTCQHLRNEHQGGMRNFSRFTVHNCMVNDCKCTKYYADMDTLQVLNARSNDLLKSLALVAAVGLLVGIGSAYIIDNTFDKVTILSTETGKATYNYTDTFGSVNAHTYTYEKSIKDDVRGTVNTLILIIIAIGTMSGIMGICLKSEREFRRWCMSKTEIDL